jgi:DNA-binding beta-propeller fold protein YncE
MVGGSAYRGCVRFPDDDPAREYPARHGRRPAARQPAVRQPAVRQPAVRQPVSRQRVSRQPASRRPSRYRPPGRRPPGRGPTGRRPSDSARYGRRRLIALLACVVVAGGAVWVGVAHHPGGDPDSPAGTGRPASASHAPAAAPARLALQVIPAPYQLPAPISREVVLPPSGTLGRAHEPALIIAGGLTSASVTTAAIRLLNPQTGQTRVMGRLAVATHDAAGAVLGSRPFVFGGGSLSSTDAVQSGQPGQALATTGRLPSVRSDLSAVTVAGQAYLVGGYNGVKYDSAVLATADGRRFRVAARLPVPVRYPAVAALGSRIWVFGGQTRSGITSTIQRVYPATGKATVVGQLPVPLAHATGFTLGGRIFIAGGQTAPATGQSGIASPSARLSTSDRVFQYIPSSAQAPASGRRPAPGVIQVAGHLPVPVANAAAAVIGSTAYLVGGDNGHRPFPAVTTFRLVPAASAIPAVAAGVSTAPAPPGPGGIVAAQPLLADAPWLAPAHGRGHLIRGSDPSVLPGDILIADHLNNRLLIVDPQGRVRWQFPRPGDLARGQTFNVPDDAFFSPDGKYIIATQEDDFVISVISVATHKIVYRYGTPGVPGSGPNHVDNPDDALLAPGGDIVSADIKNCRIIMIDPPAHHVLHSIGQGGGGCMHQPPHRFGSPNGAFPLTDGRYLVTEINGDWVDEMSLTGQVSWSTHPPGVLYPSDTNEVYPGRYLTVDYSNRGQVVEFDSHGRRLWRFGGLNKPSLGLPLPNGDILVNDDFNNRVIVIDPVTHRIVWQYGHKGVAGSKPGYLHDPDGVDLTPPNSLLITHSGTMGRP